MIKFSLLLFLLMAVVTATAQTDFARRDTDWRMGAIVYQVFVDRFAPSANLDAKRAFYAAPRLLLPWETPLKKGTENKALGLWTHELTFYGGDLPSVRTRTDYLQALGVDVIYLNPIVDGFTAHKYDANDWASVAPEYGTRQDVIALADDLHKRKMKLMLDGVFNHAGRHAPRFTDALKNPQSPYRDWFYIGSEYRGGYRAWANVANLVEVNLENEAVRRHLWKDKNSVVQQYLREGVDGWRLDVAYDIGMNYLRELTESAHAAKPGSAVIGEIWNYPDGWFTALDGIYNMFAGKLIFQTVRGTIAPPQAGKWLERMIADAGTESILKSWLILDNHDTPRLAYTLPEQQSRQLAQALQFTLPGSPLIYYGAELGMSGGGDPENRSAMQWEKNTPQNADLVWMKTLIGLRKAHRALRIGDFRLLDSAKLLAFARVTDKARETVIVAANPTDAEIVEEVPVRVGLLMNYAPLRDVLSKREALVASGFISFRVPAKSIQVFALPAQDPARYTPYKRTP